jgi:hypothetical protein
MLITIHYNKKHNKCTLPYLPPCRATISTFIFCLFKNWNFFLENKVKINHQWALNHQLLLTTTYCYGWSPPNSSIHIYLWIDIHPRMTNVHGVQKSKWCNPCYIHNDYICDSTKILQKKLIACFKLMVRKTSIIETQNTFTSSHTCTFHSYFKSYPQCVFVH